MSRTLGEAGEFGLIDRLTARLPQGLGVVLGPGDDAAVVAVPDRRVVATTDILVEGTHFRREWCTAHDVGRKAAAQNLADVAAMGAVPTALLVGLAAPAGLPEVWALDLADGLREECTPVGVSVVGGDVVAGRTLTVAVTALGDLQGRNPVTRAGARPGDVVAVSGRLGWAAAGLALLRQGLRDPADAVMAYCRPVPPYRQGPAAATAGATAMIDISDGLVQDLGHVAAASGVGIALDRGALPVSPVLHEAGAALGLDPLGWVLTGGEDHALAATFPPGAGLPPGWDVLGAVVEGVGVTIDGEPAPARGGHDHFA